MIFGADRIAANGDMANKIGTYSCRVLARAHGIPFYVAAPTSTIDLAARERRRDPDRAARRRRGLGLRAGPLAPEASPVANPAFDVTPAANVTAIITERGVHRVPYLPQPGREPVAHAVG